MTAANARQPERLPSSPAQAASAGGGWAMSARSIGSAAITATRSSISSRSGVPSGRPSGDASAIAPPSQIPSTAPISGCGAGFDRQAPLDMRPPTVWPGTRRSTGVPSGRSSGSAGVSRPPR